MFIISQTATYAIVTTSIAQTSFYFKSIQSGYIKKEKKNLHFVNRTGEICICIFIKKKKRKREKKEKGGKHEMRNSEMQILLVLVDFPRGVSRG